MRELVCLITVVIVATGITYAENLGGPSKSMMAAEFGLGTVLGVGAFIGLHLLIDEEAPEGAGEVNNNTFIPSIIAGYVGYVAGSAGGILLVGELADGPSGNKFGTYALTFLCSMIPVPIVNTIVATGVYNAVKEPKQKPIEIGGVGLRPLSGFLTGSGGRIVSTYGVELSF